MGKKENGKNQGEEKPSLEIQNFNSYDELYESITKEGSLGILALGAVGLKLWRMKRAEIKNLEKNPGINER